MLGNMKFFKKICWHDYRWSFLDGYNSYTRRVEKICIKCCKKIYYGIISKRDDLNLYYDVFLTINRKHIDWRHYTLRPFKLYRQDILENDLNKLKLIQDAYKELEFEKSSQLSSQSENISESERLHIENLKKIGR